MSREKEEAGTRLILEGRVQGVGFRFFTQRRATALGLRGWVRNLPDGTVEAEAWGPSAALAEFKEQLNRIRNRKDQNVSVLHHLESNTINAVKVWL